MVVSRNFLVIISIMDSMFYQFTSNLHIIENKGKIKKVDIDKIYKVIPSVKIKSIQFIQMKLKKKYKDKILFI